ncbi:MAG: pilus assembly FimT family protein [Bacillota bacterium]|jgi:prepilin-type N-terminal cleavage/methylation domain-containing protein|nr:prepilin-type N-terminal cleavage/methylation domain-containing protein [Clostridia bacterium]
MRKRIKDAKGFTLVELICVLTIVSILMGIAVPKFSHSLARWELDVAAWKMAIHIRKWQQKAVTEQRFGLRLVIDQKSRKFHLKDGSVIKETYDMSNLLKSISFSPEDFYMVEFYPTGVTSAAGTYALENYQGAFKYIVILNSTGRVRISSKRP